MVFYTVNGVKIFFFTFKGLFMAAKFLMLMLSLILRTNFFLVWPNKKNYLSFKNLNDA